MSQHSSIIIAKIFYFMILLGSIYLLFHHFLPAFMLIIACLSFLALIQDKEDDPIGNILNSLKK